MIIITSFIPKGQNANFAHFLFGIYFDKSKIAIYIIINIIYIVIYNGHIQWFSVYKIFARAFGYFFLNHWCINKQ